MLCPLCRSASKFAFETKGYRLLDCASCGHRFAGIEAGEAHVAAVYDDSYFNGGGAGYADYAADGEMLRTRGRMYANLVAPFAPSPGTLLDVGAAAGFLLKGFADEGWRGVGSEPNEAMCRYGRERLGLAMHQGSFESFATSERFDLISMIQVAAHFYDPHAAFAKARDLLRADGLLLVETWKRDSLSARLLGRRWHEYSPPSVLQWYGERALDGFLAGLGFARVGGGRPKKKISGEHARSLLRYRLGDNFLLRLIPARINFPYPAEDLFWAVYRKQ